MEVLGLLLEIDRENFLDSVPHTSIILLKTVSAPCVRGVGPNTHVEALRLRPALEVVHCSDGTFEPLAEAGFVLVLRQLSVSKVRNKLIREARVLSFP